MFIGDKKKTIRVNILQDFYFTHISQGFNLILEQKIIIEYLQIQESTDVPD